MALKYITAEEAASIINNGDNVGFSGFTPAGSPKAVSVALAERAEAEHAAGRPFKINMFTGASTGDSVDGVLTRAGAIGFRAPYQTNGDMRKALNSQSMAYADLHLSQMAQEIRYGFMGKKVNVAIIEAADVTEDGKIYVTTGVGISPTIARMADTVIIELNAAHSKSIKGLHDIYEPLDPPGRREIAIYKPSDRIGKEYIQVDPAKIAGIVETDKPDEARGFTKPDPVTDRIGLNVANFLAADMKRGCIPPTFLPLQSGVGNVANAVLGALGADPEIPAFEMYTEVIQDSVIALMEQGRIKFGSTCSLSVTNECLDEIYSNMSFFRDKLLLRPSEISNNPEVVRRLGVITINPALDGIDAFITSAELDWLAHRYPKGSHLFHHIEFRLFRIVLRNVRNTQKIPCTVLIGNTVFLITGSAFVYRFFCYKIHLWHPPGNLPLLLNPHVDFISAWFFK